MPSLKDYRAKRKFANTPEPKGQALFCVQKHKARRLHYDFRLELDGVLVSFAIPKGPSMDPEVKRLAVHVEDHPLEYINFEGEIPKGNYGAGIVEIWDIGTYEADKKKIRDGLKKGHLHFFLNGKKLKGEFALVKIKDPENKNWLFFKLQKMPDFIPPMLATLTDKPFNSPEWIFEIKWDGYRAIAHLNGNQVNLWSRNQKLINSDYPNIVSALKELNMRAILDGEIVVLDEKGVSHFELLQEFKKNKNPNLYYMIFDLLFLDGKDLRSLPLNKRKEKLQEILQDSPPFLRFSDHVDKYGIKLFHEAKKKGLEGLMAKLKDSGYVSHRSLDWLKIKTSKREEFIVCGFTKPKAKGAYFGALLLGTYRDDKIEYAGKVGTGFNIKNIKEIFQKMKPLIKEDCPFPIEPKNIKNVTWIKPKLMAEVSFAQITKKGMLRQPVFHGLRSDAFSKLSSLRKQGSRHNATSLDSRLRGNDNKLFTNLEKIFWKKEGFKKKDLLSYYEAMAPFILPHLRGRPLTFIRFPNGVENSGFYQKNIEQPPKWLRTENIEHIRYALVEDEKSLMYFANLAAIEFHPMLASIDNLNHPDFLVLDLDREELPFKKVVEVALATHDFLDDIGVDNYCKTSGGTGLHIYVPLGGKINFKQSLDFAQLIAFSIKEKLPSLISLDRSPSRRKKKIYIDCLQNSERKSVIAPYSLRARPHAPVSTPLKWNEVKEYLDPLDYNIKSVPKRVLKIKDIFAPILENGINLKAALKRLEKLL